MKTSQLLLVLSMLLALSPVTVRAATPTATSFSATASTAGATLLQLQGADADGTALTFAIGTSPSHGTLSGLQSATGYVIYTPTAGYSGADSFTFTVTSGGDTTAPATVSLTVTNAKTRIVDTLVDAAGAPRAGTVTFILTQKVTSPAGLIPVSASVSAVLSHGQFDVSVYPSIALTPQAFYQVWFSAAGSLRRELIGVYAIPATAATSVVLAPYAVTDTNLTAQYSFMPAAAINALATGLSSPVVSFNARTGAITPTTNDYTWAQINKSTSSLADLTTRSAADLSSGTLPDARFPSTLPALNGSNLTTLNASNLSSGTVAPARLGSLTDGAFPYKTSGALADSPLLRYGAGTVGFGAGTPAAPSTSDQTTGTRLLFLSGASGEHLGIGVQSGALWFNIGSANTFKYYWGASTAERHTVAPNSYTAASAQSDFTFDFQSSSISPGAFVITSNQATIRLQPNGNNIKAWDVTATNFRPFTDHFLDLGDDEHRIKDAFINNVIVSGTTSGSTTIKASAVAGTTTLTLPAATDTLVGQATVDTLTNKTIDAEATGNALTIPIKVFLAAAGCNNTVAGSFWDLPTSAAAVPACVTGTNTQKGVLDFADAGAASAQTTMILPADFAGAIDARIIWTTSATSGNAKWSLSTICTDVNASATDDPSFNTASPVTTAAPGTANRVQTSSIAGVTATGCGAGNLLHLKILRDGTDAGDTIAATARLIGVEITIRRAM